MLMLKNIRGYRPMSLVGCIHKFLSKVMAQRLRAIMGDLISQNQNAFVRSVKF